MPEPRTPGRLDDSRWRVTAGSDARGWKDITGIIDGLTYTSIRPGGPASAQMNMRGVDYFRCGFNEVHVDSTLRIEYENKLAWDGVLRPQKYQYGSESAGGNDDVIPLEAAGLVDQAKRRSDYSRFWGDKSGFNTWSTVVSGPFAAYTLNDNFSATFGASSADQTLSATYAPYEGALAPGSGLSAAIFDYNLVGVNVGLQLYARSTDSGGWTCLLDLMGTQSQAGKLVSLPAGTREVYFWLWLQAGFTGTSCTMSNLTIMGEGFTRFPTMEQVLTDIFVAPGLADSVQVPYPPLSVAGDRYATNGQTTRGAAGEAILALSGEPTSWELRGGVLKCERIGANVDASRVFPVTHDTPGVTVDLVPISDTKPDAFYVRYKQNDLNCGLYYPAEPLGVTDVVENLDVPGSYVTDEQAWAAGTVEWTKRSSHVADGTIGVIGGIANRAGLWTPAPLLSAGDYVDIVDMVGHAPLMITGVTYDCASDQATLTVGGLETRRVIVPGAPVAAHTYVPAVAAPTAEPMGGARR